MGVNTTGNISNLEALANSTYQYQIYAQNANLHLFAEANGYYNSIDQIQSDEWINQGTEPIIMYMTPIARAINTFNTLVKIPLRSSRPLDKLEKVTVEITSDLPPILQIVGYVYDEKTMEPLVADLLVNTVVGKKTNTLTTVKTGKFEIENPEFDIYNYEVLLEGYYSKKGSIKVEELEKDGIVEVVVLLTPIETGITIALPNMLFVQSKAELLEISFSALDSIRNVMIENPTLEILLSGHTDGVGDPQLNQQLSEDRVATVKQYLVDSGINSERIEIEAFGGKKPVASNAREETRRLNRRVELAILKY